MKITQRFPSLRTRGFLPFMVFVGAVVGILLLLLKAPLWTYYVVPSAVMTPLLLWEFSRINRRERRQEEAESARPVSSREKAHHVAGA